MATLVACPPKDTSAAPQTLDEVVLSGRISRAVQSARDAEPTRAEGVPVWKGVKLPTPRCLAYSPFTVDIRAQPARLLEVYRERQADLQLVCDLLNAKQEEMSAIRERKFNALENVLESSGEDLEEWRGVVRECKAHDAVVSKEIAALAVQKRAREEDVEAALEVYGAARSRMLGSKEHLRLLTLAWAVERDNEEVDKLVDELLDEVVAEDPDAQAEAVAACLGDLLDNLAAEEDVNEAAGAPEDAAELEEAAKDDGLDGSEAELELDPTISTVPTICANEGVEALADVDCEARRAEADRERAAQVQRAPPCERAWMLMYLDLEDSAAEEQEGPWAVTPQKCAKSSTASGGGNRTEAKECDSRLGTPVCPERLGSVKRAVRRERQGRRAAFEAFRSEERRVEVASGEAPEGEGAGAVMNKTRELAKGLEKSIGHSQPWSSTAHPTERSIMAWLDEFITDNDAFIWAFVGMALTAIVLHVLSLVC